MIIKLKNQEGVSSSAGEVCKRGNKGCLKLYFEKQQDGTYHLKAEDFGGYGRSRWVMDFGPFSQDDTEQMISDLKSLWSQSLDTTEANLEDILSESGLDTVDLSDDMPTLQA